MSDFQEGTSRSCEPCWFFRNQSCMVPGCVCVRREIDGTDQTVGDILWRVLSPEKEKI